MSGADVRRILKSFSDRLFPVGGRASNSHTEGNWARASFVRPEAQVLDHSQPGSGKPRGDGFSLTLPRQFLTRYPSVAPK